MRKDRLLPTLCLVTALTATPLLITYLAWGGGSIFLLVVVGFLGLLAAGVAGFWHSTFAALVGGVSSSAMWAGLVEDVGWFLIFHPDDSILYATLLLPAFSALGTVGMSVLVWLDDRMDGRRSGLAAVCTVVMLFCVLPALYVDRSFRQSHFASFNFENQSGAEMAIMPQPFDTRALVVSLSSEEVIRAVLDSNPDTSAGLHMNNARFEVRYNFNKLRSVTLQAFDDRQLEHPVTWPADQVRGDVSFLIP